MLFLACLCLVIWVTDRPLLTRPRHDAKQARAAFAIRDHVIAFQEWGTRSFTVPGLESAYGHVEYVTLGPYREGRYQEVIASLTRFLTAHECVDLYLLAHSNHFVEWVDQVPHELRKKIRLVYNTGCFNLGQKERWMALGITSYVGHVGSSESPVFYVYFLRRWTRGGRLDEVVAESNRLTESVLSSMTKPLFSNPASTIAQTHAELSGDPTITIDQGAS